MRLDPAFNRTRRHASRIPVLAVAARRLTSSLEGGEEESHGEDQR